MGLSSLRRFHCRNSHDQYRQLKRHSTQGMAEPGPCMTSRCSPASPAQTGLTAEKELVSQLTWKYKCLSLSCVQLFETPWTVAQQAPQSMGFSRQEYWSGLPSPSPGNLPDLGIELVSPVLARGFFTAETPGKPYCDMATYNLPYTMHFAVYFSYSFP